MDPSGYLTDIGGLRVGHATDRSGVTGCTVILCDAPMTGGVDVRGSATGTREIELLRPTHLIQHVHAILLAGGSAYGLDAAAGVMRFLEEHDIGFDIRIAKVPIIPAAILLDLAIGNPTARPTGEMAYQACSEAGSGSFGRGNVGAGTGATVGKIYGMSRAMKSGIGTACVDVAGGIKVGALFAVNAFGDIVDPSTGVIVAGARLPDDSGFADTACVLKQDPAGTVLGFPNTVIGLAATNAFLTKEETCKFAQMASNGIAKTVSPAHTSFDGDVVFALSRADSRLSAPVSAIGCAAAEAVASAILDAVACAESIEQIPAARDVSFSRRKT
ncbi:MAG: peptidase S58 family protein [Candidatus Abyssobacteria bacterium SURF_5]|uniref:Peptidase S58 family protein n=1 Tax=Abyssobacteria bacterium (strain SURF_5) TaxID=2093360 RepID=A0A3A4N7G4_ABYX5|nr:MAG: peptidase S58 family protein [Candidatus Abyssubacteria bacterium SURF_5]